MNKSYMRAYRARNRARIRVKRRAWAGANRDKEISHEKKYREKNPLKRLARKRVELKRRQGSLRPPSVCPSCGAKVGKGADGRSLAQAHHADHGKDRTSWRCPACHKGM
jgi:uncharacterized protein with PIN domain